MVLAALAAFASVPPAAPPDLVLYDGKIFTADSAHPWAQAIAIRGERIVAVGQDDEIRPTVGPHTRVIDLHGRVVIPGINDAHDHVGLGPIGRSFLSDPSPIPDPPLAEVLDSLRAAAAAAPAGTWLRAVIGPTVIRQTEGLRAALDQAAPDNPVLLWAWWGHGAVVNSAGLRALGIGEADADPLGGHYQRYQSGRLTGWLQEYAGWGAVRRLNSALPDSVLVANLRQYVDGRVQLGVTSIQNMAGYLDPPTTIRVFRAARLPVRMRLVRWSIPDTASLRLSEWDSVDQHPDSHTVVSGVKWVVDGTPIEGLWSRPDFSADVIRGMLSDALHGKQQYMLHVVGDSATRLVLSLMESLAPAEQWRGKRLRIEHGPGITDSLIDRARRIGIVIGQPRVEGGSSMQSWERAGIPLAYGSDNSPNPFFDFMQVVTSPGNPAEALSREDAVTMFTRGSAYAEFQEHEKGMLAPGMLADLAVLSQDIFTVPVDALPATTSVLTVLGGKVVYSRN
ncbi:MAG TPA: amidohydrolase [Gemmatimonadales bacterium]|nr:amidohydrolase [Gemmatimonadales bacterium]